jgi:hypothetical protein
MRGRLGIINGLQLYLVADLEVQNLKIKIKCQTKNKTAFLPNPCYTLLFFC